MATNYTLKIEAQKRRIRIMEEKRERAATRVGTWDVKIVNAKDKLRNLEFEASLFEI